MSITSPEQFEKLRACGTIVGTALRAMAAAVRPATTELLRDWFARARNPRREWFMGFRIRGHRSCSPPRKVSRTLLRTISALA